MKSSGVVSRFPRYVSVNNVKDTQQNQETFHTKVNLKPPTDDNVSLKY